MYSDIYRDEITKQDKAQFIRYSLKSTVDNNVSVLTTVNNMVSKIIAKNHLDSSLIRNLTINYTRMDLSVSVQLDYCKFNPDEEEKIYSALMHLGYSRDNIRSVKKSDSIWTAEVSDQDIMIMMSEYDFYSAEQKKREIQDKVQQALDFEIQIYF